MARRFVYSDAKSDKVIYDRVVPNHISEDDVVAGMIRDTGVDPRITLVKKSIRTVDDEELRKPKAKTRKRYKRK